MSESQKTIGTDNQYLIEFGKSAARLTVCSKNSGWPIEEVKRWAENQAQQQQGQRFDAGAQPG
jgi:hypothetical protein